MINVVDNKIDLKSLEVRDIIDVAVLQKFLDNFAIGMNCAAVSVDREGKEITNPSHYRPFCSDFIHKSSLGDARCAKCHNEMGQESIRLGKPYIDKCHAGLIDFAAPIIVQGEHLGTVLGGQVLMEHMTDMEIGKVAGDLGFEKEKIGDAAKKIDIVPKDNIAAAAEVLFTVVNTMAQDGFSRIETELLSNKLANNFFEISKTVEMLAQSAQEITESQHNLTTEISDIA